ncbi:AsmA family protein [Bradyrhizobium sp. LHD-71]|uniref:AsmA family protein n=1 Tax=Bradyrhizobium sp. LHD-71 TaxID=3072141 RepID=UPI00280D2632|nr:AsmA family protein [Bradyrhizobium sp. LHD-71]MDQ8727839.1 AsmA-like C-terminal region-containing protein [Bradyrhizobium sp. LHD-71]
MQTTLLGLAIALILALLAALIGPYFIDWSQFRPQFEREASRVIGMPVRVDGEIDARLLPTPSLRLRHVAVGARSDASNVSVEKLDVEFSLGDLMRGEWRANELTLDGLVLELGLDQRGRMNWASRGSGFNLGALTVDKFHLTGAIAVNDTASRRSLRLNDIVFTGEVRAVAGSVRGEGAAKLDGVRYPFRLASARTADGSGQRLRLNLDPGARSLAADLDGILLVDDAVPRFEGSLSIAQPPPPKSNAPLSLADAPWRVAGKLKADPASARLEQVEAVFGPEDAGLKFSGNAEARFGASPRLRGSLAARQLDADRLLARAGVAAPSPADLMANLRWLIAAAPPMPLPIEFDIDAELINLGARPVQAVGISLQADAKEWRVGKFELRAPGSTLLAVTGRIAELGNKASFSGRLDLDASDPEGFALWLQGQSDNAYRGVRPLKAAGDIVISGERVAVDAFKADIDGRPLDGRFALVAADGKSRLDAALRAERLDFDAGAAFARAMGGALKTWPDEAALGLDIAELNLSGQTLKPVQARFTYNAKAIALERLRVGDADGVAIDGAGAFDRANTTGQLKIDATAATLDPLARLIAPIAPEFSRRIGAVPRAAGNVWAGLTLDLGKPQGDRAALRTTVDLHAPQVKGALTGAMTPQLASLRNFDMDALAKNEATLTATLSTEHGNTLLALLGLDGVLAAGNGPAQFDGSATGVWNAPTKLKAKLTGNGLDAEIDGSVEPFKTERAAAVSLNVRKANIAPLIGIARAEQAPWNIALTSRVGVTGQKVTLDNLDGAIAGARVRGRLGLALGEEIGVEGNVGADVLDVPSAMLAAIGAAGHDSAEPLNRGLLSGWRGRVEFSALRATVPGGELRPFNGVLRNDGQALVLEGLSAGLGGGKLQADLSARRSPEGVALAGRVQLDGVDGAALKHRALAMPPGRVSARTSVSGQGRSAAALIGSLNGNGSVTIEQARIAGLDPRAFDAATRASDAGIARDDAKLAAMVAPALAAGTLNVTSAEVPFAIRDGQVRVSNTTLMGEGARLNLSGGYDIAADQIDVRAALAATTTDVLGFGRPEILVLLFGSPDKPDRTIDVAALSSWLGLRAIDRETRRLDAIERANPLLNPGKPAEPAPPVAPQATPLPSQRPAIAPRAAEAPPPVTAPALPPPVEIRPAPGARPQPRHNAPLNIVPMQPRSALPSTF